MKDRFLDLKSIVNKIEVLGKSEARGRKASPLTVGQQVDTTKGRQNEERTGKETAAFKSTGMDNEDRK